MEEIDLGRFTNLVFVDFEFYGDEEQDPTVVCMVARIARRTGVETIRLWADELHRLKAPPYPIGSESLFIAYNASAKLRCHLALKWQLPKNVLDLYVEFKRYINGMADAPKAGLISALRHFGLSYMEEDEKDRMRELILSGDPRSVQEQKAILRYCERDVTPLPKVLEQLSPYLTEHSLFRGKYMGAVAQMERTGIPVDAETRDTVFDNWGDIRLELVTALDEFGLFEETSFRSARFEKFLRANNIQWPRLKSGLPELQEATFRDMCRRYPKLHVVIF